MGYVLNDPSDSVYIALFKLIGLLGIVGFKPIRQRGSYIILMDKEGTRIVVPVHPGKKLKPGLIKNHNN
ncbi:MAG: type II toxin-antitoxin system HicA family toxin [Staphylothermus sp.]|nr:type II toxin-antitoxin system HicA family toxin [Staphylothermus sp.]